MKGKKLTFVVYDSVQHKVHMCQHRTFARTIEEAFQQYSRFVLARRFQIDDPFEAEDRFSLVGAISGLVQFIDNNQLRAPTREEVKKLASE